MSNRERVVFAVVIAVCCAAGAVVNLRIGDGLSSGTFAALSLAGCYLLVREASL